MMKKVVVDKETKIEHKVWLSTESTKKLELINKNVKSITNTIKDIPETKWWVNTKVMMLVVNSQLT